MNVKVYTLDRSVMNVVIDAKNVLIDEYRVTVLPNVDNPREVEIVHLLTREVVIMDVEDGVMKIMVTTNQAKALNVYDFSRIGIKGP